MELVAAIPALVVVALVALQLGLAGYGLWSAATAARVGARAAYVGADAGTAARAALPQPLRRRARVDAGDGVEVRVDVPRLLPGLGRLPVAARADLTAAPGEDGHG